MAVMGVALIVSMSAMCAITVARTQLRKSLAHRDWQTARLLAQSGIELATSVMNNDANWQTTYPYDAELPSPAVSVNGGTMTWKMIKQSSGLVRVDGIGRKGTSTCVLSTTVIPPAANVFQTAITASTGITVASSLDSLTIDTAIVASNGTIENLGAITANTEAQVFVGNPPSGTLTAPGALRAMPDPISAFDYYVSKGTDITAGLFPLLATNAKLTNVLLSPSENPYGATNPEGIYYANCLGRPVTIESCRIVGTLVLLNAATETLIQGEVNWEPAIPNYPALMVQGPVRISLTDKKLDEGVLLKNFNPSSTPWVGSSDIVTDDLYPSAMAGIIYCVGTLTFDGKNSSLVQQLHGVTLVEGLCVLKNAARVSIKYEDKALLTPPPGFAFHTTPRIQIGSWHQVPSY